MSVPNWNASGDWFDVCKCNIPCPCTFAQASSYGDCEGVLAYHIKKGRYGDTPLEGFNVMMVGGFRGNIWAGEVDAMGFHWDWKGESSKHIPFELTGP
jgi:hypothetical protein